MVGSGNICSRFELLHWLNTRLQKRYKNLEDLSNGVAYCELINSVQPALLPLQKIKMNPYYTYESYYNFQQLRKAFIALNIEQPINTDALVKGSFLQHWDLLQYLKYFIEYHTDFDFDECALDARDDICIKQNAATKCTVATNTSQIMLQRLTEELFEELNDAKDQIKKLLLTRDCLTLKLSNVKNYCMTDCSNPVIQNVLHILNEGDEKPQSSSNSAT